MNPTAGYYREGDSVLYVSEAGAVYYVSGPDTPEPAWRPCEGLGGDARPRKPGAEELGAFERARKAYGIAA